MIPPPSNGLGRKRDHQKIVSPLKPVDSSGHAAAVVAPLNMSSKRVLHSVAPSASAAIPPPHAPPPPALSLDMKHDAQIKKQPLGLPQSTTTTLTTTNSTALNASTPAANAQHAQHPHHDDDCDKDDFDDDEFGGEFADLDDSSLVAILAQFDQMQAPFPPPRIKVNFHSNMIMVLW